MNRRIEREERTCACGCGEVFVCKKNSQQRYLYHHQCHDSRVREKIRKTARENWVNLSQEKKDYTLQGFRDNKGYWTGKTRSREDKEKISNTLSGRTQTEEANRKRSKTSARYWQDPVRRERQGKETKRWWQDPEYVAKQMKSRGVKPNKSEKFFIEFIDEVEPNEWKYVGDGQFILGGKCPDFVNVNEKKKLIELFGDWYHSKEFAEKYGFECVSPEDRTKYFKKFGFDTLVIWEHELKDLNMLKERILEFNGK